MKRFSEQLNTRAQSVKLRASEKRELRERVVSYMEYHPLPAEMKVSKNMSKNKASKTSEPFTTLQIPFHSIFKYSTLTAAFILLAVPFVAERAVPGDALYSIKVQFNEELRSTLTFDTYQKVEWETERLNRRIAEARLLASEGRLTKEAELDVAQAVRVHSANAQREIETLRFEDVDAATIASITLDTTLELQSDSLKGEDDTELSLTIDPTSSSKSINLIASAIDESRNRSDENNSSTTVPAYDKLMAKVEQNTTRIQELLSALEKVAPAEDLVDVQRRADDIDRAVLESIEVYSDNELDSRLKLVDVLQRTQRLIVYMTELDVIKTIDIKTLIPVVLTEGEQKAERESLIAKLNQKISQIDEFLVKTENAEVKEKVSSSRDEIHTYFNEMNSASTSFEVFKEISINAINLADDSIKLFNEEDLPQEVVVEEVASTTKEVMGETASTTENNASSTEVESIDVDSTESI